MIHVERRLAAAGFILDWSGNTNFTTGFNDNLIWYTHTPTPTPTPNGISGHVYYYSNGLPVPGAAMLLSGSLPTSAQTAADGGFGFNGLVGQSWELTPRKQGGAGTGISTVDALYVSQAVVGLREFTPEQRLACEVSGNGTISTLDASLILKRVVGLIQHFPVADLCSSDWVFEPVPEAASNQSIIDPRMRPGSCQMGAIAYNPLSSAASNQDFFAMLLGDCTGNWPPPPVPTPTPTPP